MVGRSTAKKTLTKIDPSSLKHKPFAVSQHAARSGARVTKTVNPIRHPPVPPVDPLILNFDPANFGEEPTGDTTGDEDVSREYHVAQVRTHLPPYVETDHS